LNKKRSAFLGLLPINEKKGFGFGETG